MKLKSQDLTEALNRLKPIIGRRKTLPVLSCVKMHTERNWLHLTVSDLDQYQVERIECDGGIDPICVSFQYLSNALGGEIANIVTKKDFITVNCDFGSTELATLSADEFPPPPKMDKAKILGVSCEDLSGAIGSVSWAASNDPSRYNLQSVFISSEAKKLHTISTNGRELAMVELALIGSDFKLIVPSDYSSNMADALLRKSAELQANENWVKVSHESGWYSCKQIDGKYPNYRQVIPAKKTKLGEVGVPEFKELVGRTLGFNEAKECKGIFTFSKDGIEIDFIGQNNSKLRHQFPGKFEPFKVGINTRALFNSLSHVKEQKITIYSDSVSGNLGPITIQAGDLMILTMPMRLS